MVRECLAEMVTLDSKSSRVFVSDSAVMVVAQSCPTLCDRKDYSLLGFSVHGILQAKILEWVAIPFSRGHRGAKSQTQLSMHV